MRLHGSESVWRRISKFLIEYMENQHAGFVIDCKGIRTEDGKKRGVHVVEIECTMEFCSTSPWQGTSLSPGFSLAAELWTWTSEVVGTVPPGHPAFFRLEVNITFLGGLSSGGTIKSVENSFGNWLQLYSLIKSFLWGAATPLSSARCCSVVPTRTTPFAGRTGGMFMIILSVSWGAIITLKSLQKSAGLCSTTPAAVQTNNGTERWATRRITKCALSWLVRDVFDQTLVLYGCECSTVIIRVEENVNLLCGEHLDGQYIAKMNKIVPWSNQSSTFLLKLQK